jgi:TatD DNase family protein
MRSIDTHSHFNLSQFDADRDAAIARMEEKDVQTICIGVDLDTSIYAAELAKAHASIWAIVGQHPTEWCKAFDQNAFEELLKQENVVGIGECGLDYFRERDRGEKETQVQLFEAQIAFAATHNLPLMLHIRPQQGTMDAYDDALAILKRWKQQYPDLTGTAHFFVGDKRIAQEFLDLGFYISFSGVITIFPEYEDMVRFVPIDRMLSETDAPFAAPLPWRGKRCEPQYVLEVVRKIAELKELPLADVERQLLENAERLFKL